MIFLPVTLVLLLGFLLVALVVLMELRVLAYAYQRSGSGHATSSVCSCSPCWAAT